MDNRTATTRLRELVSTWEDIRGDGRIHSRPSLVTMLDTVRDLFRTIDDEHPGPLGTCDTPNCDRAATWIPTLSVPMVPQPFPRYCRPCCDVWDIAARSVIDAAIRNPEWFARYLELNTPK